MSSLQTNPPTNNNNNNNNSKEDIEATSSYQLHSSPSPSDRRRPYRFQPKNDDDEEEEEEEEEEHEYSSDEDSEDEEENEMSIKELMYAANSYHTIAKPVTLTMILAALAVIFINTQSTIEQGAAQMASTYNVFSLDTSTDSKTTTLAKSLANTLVMVSVICIMTFFIVFLYKMRCMKCLIGYMVFSSATLLGLLGGLVFEVAIFKYSIPIDVLSFYFGLYNFALVGIVAVFYQSGIPSIVTRGYLVATSVILSWQLSHFDDWTAWTLLIMLALYDLCAVLTPCGPLKALVNLMSREDAPEMPGLLYEAELPTTSNNSQQSSQQQQHQQLRSISQVQRSSSSASNAQSKSAAAASASASTARVSDSAHVTADDGGSALELPSTAGSTASYGAASSPPRKNKSNDESVDATTTPPAAVAAASLSSSSMTAAPTTGSATPPPSSQLRTVTIPLAIAKLYRLPLTRAPSTTRGKQKQSKSSSSTTTTPAKSSPSDIILGRRHSSGVSTSPLLESTQSHEDDGHDEEHQLDVEDQIPSTTSSKRVEQIDPLRTYTPKELNSMVTAILPPHGGNIECLSSSRRKNKKVKYAVYDRHGQLKRVLFVNREGKVFEEIQHDDDDSDYDDDDGDMEANSIKLGLGDFIFYSVMVGKAAQHSFTAFISCLLVILAGLGGTLVLLSVYRHALPALPISIFLGVGFYLMTRLSIEPWVEEVLSMPYYV